MPALNISKNDFEEKIMKSEKTVLLDFFADWCGSCRTVSPVIDEIADENPQFFIGKINIETEPELAKKFGVSSIPTFIVMKNGTVLFRSSGAKPKARILSMLNG